MAESLQERVAALIALLPAKPVPVWEDGGRLFQGYEGGSEHRTVGEHRAWCYQCAEWCYPSIACPCCDPPVGNDQIRALLGLTDG